MASESKHEQQLRQWFNHLDSCNIEVLYVYGVGTGSVYLAAREWLSGNELRSLVFLEENLQLIDQLKNSHLGDKIFNDPQVEVYPLLNDLELDKIVQPYSIFSHGVVQLESHHVESSDEVTQGRFSEITSLIAFFSNYHRSAVLGYSQGGAFFYNNFFNNILKLPFSYDGNALSGKFKGIPAIICGAGPSLDKNVEVLKKLQSRAIIFAGATSINALNAKGIVPHFGACIDPNSAQLTRLMINQGYTMPFFYRNRINHQALNYIDGEKIYIPRSTGFSIGNWMEEKLGLKTKETTISEGYNVLNFATSLAYELGCNPIITVGVDLAYSRGASYASAINSHPLHDKKSHFRTRIPSEEVLNKKDIYGQPVHTLWKWLREGLWYGLFAEEHPDILLINATEGGIGFPHVQNMTLEEVAAKHLVQHYDIQALIHGEIQNSHWIPPIQKSAITNLMAQLSTSLKRCVRICEDLRQELLLQQKEDLDSTAISQIHLAISRLNEELKKEEGFKAILKDIEQSYIRFTGLERQRLKTGKTTISQKEVNRRQNKLDQTNCELLEKTAHTNALLIDTLLNEEKSKEEQPIAISRITDATTSQDEQYSFDGKHLILCDPAIGLNYSEIVSDTYLRKEIVCYPEGGVKIEHYFQGMFLHGPSSFFSQKGQILAKSWFVHGQQQGKMETYYATGELYGIQRFLDGKKQGRQEFFYPNGSLRMILNYKQGCLHQKCLVYYPNGQLAKEQFYIEGKHEGFERFFDERGQLKVEAEYTDNQPIGKARQWYSNGQLACEIIYDRQHQKGSASYWDQEGAPVLKEESVSEGYFDTLSKNTLKVADSLTDVSTKISTLISQEYKSSSTIPPNFTEEFESLQKELTRLHELSKALDYESTMKILPESGLDPSNELAFKQQLHHKHRKMTDQMQVIDQGLRDMLKRLEQNNKDHPNE